MGAGISPPDVIVSNETMGLSSKSTVGGPPTDVRLAQGRSIASSSGSALPTPNHIGPDQSGSTASSGGSALPTHNGIGGDTAPRGGVAAAPRGPHLGKSNFLAGVDDRVR